MVLRITFSNEPIVFLAAVFAASATSAALSRACPYTSCAASVKASATSPACFLASPRARLKSVGLVGAISHIPCVERRCDGNGIGRGTILPIVKFVLVRTRIIDDHQDKPRPPPGYQPVLYGHAGSAPMSQRMRAIIRIVPSRILAYGLAAS